MTWAQRYPKTMGVAPALHCDVPFSGRAHGWIQSDVQSRWLKNCKSAPRYDRFSLFGWPHRRRITRSHWLRRVVSYADVTFVSRRSLALTADQLAGTWNLRSIQLTGQAEEATPPGTNYTLTFTDGRLSTRVDCNVCSGGFALSGRTLTAGPALACTRAACPTMAFENAYTGLLGGDSTVTLSDGMLVLSSSRGVLGFTR